MLLVLGAGPGVGYAAASRFRRAGHRVVLLARNAERLDALAERLRAEPVGTPGADGPAARGGTVGAQLGGADPDDEAEYGGTPGGASGPGAGDPDDQGEYGGVATVAVDLTDPGAVTDAVARVGAEQGRIDVLHFNPSAFRMRDPLHLSVDELFADLALGVAPLLPAVQAAQPYFVDGARVLVTGSAAADKPWHEAASLGVQKSALRNLVTSLDATLAAGGGVARGVRAVAVQVNGVLAEEGTFSPEQVAEALYQAAIRPDSAWTAHVTHPRTCNS